MAGIKSIKEIFAFDTWQQSILYTFIEFFNDSHAFLSQLSYGINPRDQMQASH